MSEYYMLSLTNKDWTFKGNSNEEEMISGTEIEPLWNIISSLKHQTYIICDNLPFFYEKIKSKEEGNITILPNFKSYKTGRNLLSLTIMFGYRRVMFRRLDKFVDIPLTLSTEINISLMEEQFQYIENEKFYKFFSMGALLSNQFRKETKFSENYENKITAYDYKYLRNFVNGGLFYLNEKFKGKIIKNVARLDKNACYQAIQLTKELPCGKPIYDCEDAECNEKGNKHITYYELEVWGKIKQGYMPFIPRTKTINNQYNRPVYFYNRLNGETLYLTQETFALLLEYYDIEDINIIKTTCFEKTQGLAKKWVEKWIKIRENSTKALRKVIKIEMNKIIGKQNSNKVFLEDQNEKITILSKTPYVPLNISIVDYARADMIRIMETYKNNFVFINTDCIHLANFKLENFKEPIGKEIGQFKLEGIDYWNFYYKVNNYINADKEYNITNFKHSGTKSIAFKNRTFLEVCDLWGANDKEDYEEEGKEENEMN